MDIMIKKNLIRTFTLAATAGVAATLAACSAPESNDVSADVNSEVKTEEVTTAQASQALADELQGKPVVVDIFSETCSGCKKIKPTLEALKKEYGSKASFVVFDVSNKKTIETAEAKAKELGLENVFNQYKSKTATVAVINPATGEVVELFRKNDNKADYVAALDTTTQQLTN